MKPWLFDILACPIDKNYPLKLYIFSFETTPEEFNEIINTFKKRNSENIKNDTIVEISERNGDIVMKDNIVMEKTRVDRYFQLILKSINELDNFYDKTNLDQSKMCFDIIDSVIKPKLIEFSRNIDKKKIRAFIPELYFLNKFKLEVEIKTGLLYCDACSRWYPIIDTIPQMLPDKYREAKKDIDFLTTNKNLLDQEFFNQDLKPFNIK